MIKGTDFSARQNWAWVSALPLTRKLLVRSELQLLHLRNVGGRQHELELLTHWRVVWIGQSEKNLSTMPSSTCKSLIGVSLFYTL